MNKKSNSTQLPSGAPPIPAIKVPSGPSPLTTNSGASRGRSHSDVGNKGSNGAVSDAASPAAQLSGLLTGGMPKLRKRGGVDTGANNDASYSSDPETHRSSAANTSEEAAPAPPTVHNAAVPFPSKINGLRPAPETIESSPGFVGASPLNPKRHLPRPAPRTSITLSAPANKPPPPPVTSRKPSAPPAPPPPPPPPPPPSSLPPSSSSGSSTPSAPPPPPPMAGSPRTSPTPRPPAPTASDSSPQGLPNTLAMQAARNAFGSQKSPPSAAPPPLPLSPASVPPPPPISAPSPPTSRSESQIPSSGRPDLDPGAYTLTNGDNDLPGQLSAASRIWIEDQRWRFPDESQFPPPRQLSGGPKRYRAGRGSSVPLDLRYLT